MPIHRTGGVSKTFENIKNKTGNTKKEAAVCKRVLFGSVLVIFVRNIFSVSGSSFDDVDWTAITRVFLIASSAGDHPT